MNRFETGSGIRQLAPRSGIRVMRSILLAGLVFSFFPKPRALARELKAYEKVASQIQLVPDASFEATTATLVAGEVECPSGKALMTVFSCISQIMSAPDFSTAIKRECLHEEKVLDCRKTTKATPVNVIGAYDMLVPGETPSKRMVARVRGGSDIDRYVGFAALDF